MDPNKPPNQLTLAERRIAAHVSKTFNNVVLIEQAWLAAFVHDLTTAICDAYGAEPLRGALQKRMELLTDRSQQESTHQALLQTALEAAAARSWPTRP